MARRGYSDLKNEDFPESISDLLPDPDDLGWAKGVVQWLADRSHRRNAFRDMNDLTKAGQILDRAVDDLSDAIGLLLKWIRFMERSEDAPNSNLEWRPEEDELLIHIGSRPNGLVWVAKALGRTEAACSTRTSHLVGVRRETIKVNGKRIEGELGDDRVHVDDVFTGVVHRRER